MSFFANDINKKEHSLWVERYRPQTLADYVGNETIKETIQQYLDNNDIPHLLLYGKAGTGKCLDYTEEVEIEMELSEDEYGILKKYEI